MLWLADSPHLRDPDDSGNFPGNRQRRVFEGPLSVSLIYALLSIMLKEINTTIPRDSSPCPKTGAFSLALVISCKFSCQDACEETHQTDMMRMSMSRPAICITRQRAIQALQSSVLACWPSLSDSVKCLRFTLGSSGPARNQGDEGLTLQLPTRSSPNSRSYRPERIGKDRLGEPDFLAIDCFMHKEHR
jgi:hypothetical protein